MASWVWSVERVFSHSRSSIGSTKPALAASAERPWCAAAVRARAVSRKAGTVELSQLAKSAMKSSSASRSVVGCWVSAKAEVCWRTTSKVLALPALMRALSSRAQRHMRSAAMSVKARGQRSSTGSGHNAAQSTARQAASGRRAHQMWSVEMCPCRMDFSRRAWSEMRRMGRSTSMRRFG